jgi:hypothetical protein
MPTSQQGSRTCRGACPGSAHEPRLAVDVGGADPARGNGPWRWMRKGMRINEIGPKLSQCVEKRWFRGVWGVLYRIKKAK